jgi:hypothetical protein
VQGLYDDFNNRFLNINDRIQLTSNQITYTSLSNITTFLQGYLRVLDANIADIKSKQNVGTITYQIPSTQITWADPVTSNEITVQNVLQDLYGHINNIFSSPSFSACPISASNVEVPMLPPNQAMSMGLDNYLTDIHSKIDNLSSLQLKHVANCTAENLSTCIEGLKGFNKAESLTYTRTNIGTNKSAQKFNLTEILNWMDKTLEQLCSYHSLAVRQPEEVP